MGKFAMLYFFQKWEVCMNNKGHYLRDLYDKFERDIKKLLSDEEKKENCMGRK